MRQSVWSAGRLKRRPRVVLRMYTFLLLESELETVPEELWGQATIKNRARKRGRDPGGMLLDQAHDHEAMRALGVDSDRRGRPELAHMLLLLVQDSFLTKDGLTKVLIHTRDDELIRVRPDTRIMRNQDKFVRLMEDLFRQGHVPRGNPLLTLEKGRTARSVLDECAGTKVLLDEGGALTRSAGFAALDGDVTLAMGGFPRGGFRQTSHAWFDHVVSVSPKAVPLWSALVPALAGFEDRALAAEP